MDEGNLSGVRSGARFPPSRVGFGAQSLRLGFGGSWI